MTRIAICLPAGMALVGSTVAVIAGSDVSPASQVTITYLANEGIMVSSGDKAVLVDALFRHGVSGYERHEPAELEKIETFDEAEAVERRGEDARHDADADPSIADASAQE